MDIIYFDRTQKLFVASGIRPEFIPMNKPFQNHPEFPPDVSTDVCHSISFYTITAGIVNSLNLFLKYINTDTKTFALNGIAGMIVSVLTIDVGNVASCFDWVAGNIDNPVLLPYKPYLEYIFEAINRLPIEDPFMNLSVLSFMATNASEIVRLLNSEKINLRPGRKKWNRSLQSAYDPIEVKFDQNGFILANENDCVRITNLLKFTIGDEFNNEKIPGAVNALFFYMFENPGDKKKYIYSSNLDDNLWQKTNAFKECNIPIFYFDYIEKIPKEIPRA